MRESERGGQKMKMKLVSMLMIVAGITVLSYPTLAEEYYDYQQQKLVKEWQNSLQNIHNGEETPAVAALPSAEDAQDEEPEASAAPEIADKKAAPDFSQYTNMEGILTIDKIDLMLPILHGATDANMKTTVASIEDTGKAGEIGNYAIAGHRNFTYGRNFNRLDEMNVGDRVQVNNGEVNYEYTVTEKLYVKPEDIWVLEENGQDKEITLVTCHPMENPTHRLIIKGKMTE
jgi:sortase A